LWSGWAIFEICEKPSHSHQKTAVSVRFRYKTAVFSFGSKTVIALQVCQCSVYHCQHRRQMIDDYVAVTLTGRYAHQPHSQVRHNLRYLHGPHEACIKATRTHHTHRPPTMSISTYMLKELHWLQVPRAYHLPVGSSCLPLSAQYGAALPHRPAPTGKQRRPAPTGKQRWLPAASMLVVVGQARCSSHRTRDHRWPCVQFNCSSCVEQFANGSAVF